MSFYAQQYFGLAQPYNFPSWIDKSSLASGHIDNWSWISAVTAVVVIVQLHKLFKLYFFRRPAKGRPFAVPCMSKYKVFVSSSTHLDELNKASADHLSFNGAIEEQFAPHIIFDGFKFKEKDVRHSIPIHSLQVGLKKHLPTLVPSLLRKLTETFQTELSHAGKEWMPIAPMTTFKRSVETLNNLVIVGEDLTNDRDFLQASMDYTRDVIITGEVLRFTPRMLHDPVGWLTMNWSDAKNKKDVIQWMIDATRKKTPEAIEKLSQHTLGLLFGGAHQAPMFLTFVLYNLCKHPEYLEPLHDEILAMSDPKDERSYNNMPLLDSFLKETARLHPVVTTTLLRKALRPFSFTDGTMIAANNWVCVPAESLMRDEARYPAASKFNGFRFLAPNRAQNPDTKFSTVSDSFVFWGGASRPCPGRFYVSLVSKMILVHLLTNYEFKLANQNAAESFAWSYAVVPHPLTKMLVRRRN